MMYVLDNWPVFVAIGVVFFVWKFGILIIKRRILHDGFSLLNYYGGGDLRINRVPGIFGGGRRKVL